MDIYWCQWHCGEPTPKVPTSTLVAQVLAVLQQHPSRPFAEMDINQLDTWCLYDRTRALEVLSQGHPSSLSLRSASTPLTSASLATGPGLLVATLELANDTVQSVPARQVLLAYIRQLVKALPCFSYAYATAGYVGEALTRQYQLPLLPDCLGLTLHWYYLLAPHAYTGSYTREALLGAPAYEVREWENGWVELLSYADPLSSADPATEQRIVALTRYLDSQRYQGY